MILKHFQLKMMHKYSHFISEASWICRSTLDAYGKLNLFQQPAEFVRTVSHTCYNSYQSHEISI